MITDTINSNVSGTDGSRLSGTDVEVGNTQITIDQTIPAATTDGLVSCAWTVANTESLFIVASQNCTLETNSGSSPANTISLIAGIPLIWGKSAGYYANLFTTDVTAFYITCTSATRLQAQILTS